jgi:DNA helicase-2/ATP-dependent DNA helicase PcrA
MNVKLVLGGPGAGKTTRLLEILDEEFTRGLQPSEVAFVSFTKKAVETAKERASEKFGIKKKDLLYFRTIHSIGFRELGLSRQDVFNVGHLKKLSLMLNMDLSNRLTLNSPFQISDGDKSLFLENFARCTNKTIKQVWHDLGEYIPWFRLKLFVDTLNEYKKAYGLFDFTDMLVEYKKTGDRLPVKVAIVDEAQDLNPLQWDVIRMAFRGSDRMYIAGDDDQAIYKWSGADVPQFLGLEHNTREILPKSWRMGKEVFDYTQEVVKGIHNRYEKDWTYDDHKSAVRYTRDIVSLQEELHNGSWYLLARNKHFLTRYETVCRAIGIPYTLMGETPFVQNEIRAIINYEKLRKGEKINADQFENVLNKMAVDAEDFDAISELPIWHDTMPGISDNNRLYYLSCLRNGYKLTAPPPVTISTIHSVKGGEADNVVLMSDMSIRSYKNYQHDTDDERRVFYVGMSRAKNNLHIVLPHTIRYFPVI